MIGVVDRYLAAGREAIEDVRGENLIAIPEITETLLPTCGGDRGRATRAAQTVLIEYLDGGKLSSRTFLEGARRRRFRKALQRRSGRSRTRTWDLFLIREAL